MNDQNSLLNQGSEQLQKQEYFPADSQGNEQSTLLMNNEEIIILDSASDGVGLKSRSVDQDLTVPGVVHDDKSPQVSLSQVNPEVSTSLTLEQAQEEANTTYRQLLEDEFEKLANIAEQIRAQSQLPSHN